MIKRNKYSEGGTLDLLKQNSLVTYFIDSAS